MVNGKMPLYLTAVVLGLLGAALVVLQPYTADWPGTEYAKPARQYIRAALRQDSAALTRLSASATAVSWGLDAGRAHGDLLGLWRGRIQAYTGERRGDTTEVFVYPSGRRCGEAPIVLRFVGSGGGNARVWQAGSTCWRP
jgi:hypothetical protein